MGVYLIYSTHLERNVIFTSKNSINKVSQLFSSIYSPASGETSKKASYSSEVLRCSVLNNQPHATICTTKETKLYIITKKNTENDGKFQKSICCSPFQLGEKKSSIHRIIMQVYSSPNHSIIVCLVVVYVAFCRVYVHRSLVIYMHCL